MLLDSNIVIYAAEPGYDALRKFVAEYGIVVSVISKVEVLSYHRLSLENLKKLEIVFQSLPILLLSDELLIEPFPCAKKRGLFMDSGLVEEDDSR